MFVFVPELFKCNSKLLWRLSSLNGLREAVPKQCSMIGIAHGAACTHETPSIIDIIKRHFLEIVLARKLPEGKKEVETIKRERPCVNQSGKPSCNL